MAEVRQRFPWPIYAILLVVIALFALAPLIGVMVADAIASANGCTLNEGAATVCMVGGNDWGQGLYAVYVLTWFLLVTLPLGGGALIVWLVVLVIHRIAWGRMQKAKTQ